MKIAIIGYGKMGKTIEKLALDRGHEIVLRSTSENPVTAEKLKNADMAIEFTNPESAPRNIGLCIETNVPVVTGSTGWNDRLEEISESVTIKKGKLFHASNFSIGVNLFFKLNHTLAKLMNNRPEYQPELKEWHHIHKKDAPSGTAVTLLNEMLQNLENKTDWKLEQTDEDNEIPVKAIREGEIFGTHRIRYKSDIDEISIEHKAHSREGFAKGAILAAEWLADSQPGVFTMNDLLEL